MGNKICFVLLVFFSMFVLTACPDSPEPDKVTLADTSNGRTLSANGDGERLIVSFTANKDWTATSSDASWCVVSPVSGVSGTAKINVDVAKNDLAQQRTANITLTAGTASISIAVTQEKGNLNSGGGTGDMDHKEW